MPQLWVVGVHSERTQGFAADPVCGEVLAYVGSIRNLKDLKGRTGRWGTPIMALHIRTQHRA